MNEKAGHQSMRQRPTNRPSDGMADKDGAAAGGIGGNPARRPFSLTLSTKLLLLTIIFVMLSEIFVFVPAVAKFRNDWLTDRLTRALTVLLMTEERGTGIQRSAEESLAMQERIEAAIRSFDVVTLANRRDGRRQLVAMLDGNPGLMAASFDVSNTGPLQSIRDAFGTLLANEPRTIIITGSPPGSNQVIEVLALEAPLRAAMLTYTRNVMILSLIISVSTAAMVYLTLTMLFVRPIKRMADNMVSFSRNPEENRAIIQPSGRADEIGIAEERLAAMQKDLQGTLASQRHLANLGLAVSKINHDLRNILASVQLFSDRLTALPDPNVQKFAPKLIAGIDRAISYCESTLVYGSAKEEPPKRKLMRLDTMVKELALLLDLEDHPSIEWRNGVATGLEIDADPEQIFRVLLNLARNAIKAMDTMEGDALVRRLSIDAGAEAHLVRIVISDSGPGVPEHARRHLFEPFRGSISKGGTGLGLAIAYEIIAAHGGTIRLREDQTPGATFEITLPHKPTRSA